MDQAIYITINNEIIPIYTDEARILARDIMETAKWCGFKSRTGVTFAKIAEALTRETDEVLKNDK